MIEFSSNKTASLLMFDAHAKACLQMMGTSQFIPGALEEQALTDAITHFKEALSLLKQTEQRHPSVDAIPDECEIDEHIDELNIPLSHRAIVLLAMLESAAEQSGFIQWNSITS